MLCVEFGLGHRITETCFKILLIMNPEPKNEGNHPPAILFASVYFRFFDGIVSLLDLKKR